MIKEFFFYRKISSVNFVRTKPFSSRDPVYVPVKSFSCTKTREIFCSCHNRWEKPKKILRHGIITACDKFIAGIPVEIPVVLTYAEGYGSYSSYDSPWNYVIINKKKYRDTKVRNFYNEKPKKDPYGFLQDGDRIPKEIVGYRFYLNTDKSTLLVQQFKLNMDKILSRDFNFNTHLPLVREELFINIKDGIFNCPEDFFVPRSLMNKIMQDTIFLVNNWAKRNLTFNTNLTGMEFIEAAVHFPYEPNLYVYTRKYCPREILRKLNLKAIRKNPDCYNELCREINVKSCRFLRKAFASDPMNLEIFRILNGANLIKDPNIQRSILESESKFIFYQEGYRHEFRENALKFFMEKYLEVRSQKSLWNLLQKNYGKLDEYEFFDTFAMFQEYYSLLPDAVKNDVLKYGATVYNHDALSKIIAELENENIEFEYSKEQLELEDSINGYEFHLPKDSYELIDIGVKLHNCVGSYKERVLEKRCTIVFAKNKGQHKLCIEIRDKKIHQQRCDHNANPAGEDLKAMQLYQKKHGLAFTGNRY